MSAKNFFYSNNLELGVSPYDFSFKFLRKSAGQDSDSDDNLEPVTDDELIVYMSPSHAKTLIPMLSMAIQEYEKEFGKIPLPPEKSKEFDDFVKYLTNHEK